MAEHCSKHDVVHGGTCWCCEEAGMTREQKDAAYSDPAFLSKRGGTAIAAAAAHTKVVAIAEKLANVPEDILAKMVAFFSDPQNAAAHVAAPAAPPAA